MPTSARWEVANSPKIPIKTGTFSGRTESSAPTESEGSVVGADDSVGPLGSCEFAADFRKKTGASCRAEQSPAPTDPARVSAAFCVNLTCFIVNMIADRCPKHKAGNACAFPDSGRRAFSFVLRGSKAQVPTHAGSLQAPGSGVGGIRLSDPPARRRTPRRCCR